VIQGLYKESARVIALPEIRERLESTGHTVVNSTPEQFSEKWKNEVEKFRRIIVDSKMPLN